MKRLSTVILALLMIICLCGCEDDSPKKSNKAPNSQIELNNIAADETVDPENIEPQFDGDIVELNDIQPQNGQAFGIDVSKWQGRIDWQAVKSSGIDFAIIRIGYRGENGIIYRDANADYNIQQAQKSGVLVGVYFFSTALSSEEAKEEAVWTATAVKGYKISYPIVYDCEGYNNPASRMYGISAPERTKNALAFLSHIKSKGYDAMIYGSKSDFEDEGCWDMSKFQNKYKIWVAHYSSPTYPQRQTPDYNGLYDMWQYTNRGNIRGIDGNYDMIVSYFKADEKDALDSSATPNTAKPPKSQDEMLYTESNDQVTAKELVNLRSGAGTGYAVVGKLKSGEFVARIGIGKNGWSKLLYNGQTVYAITSYLSNEVISVEKPDIVGGMTFLPKNDRITAKIEVNLRTLPTTNSESVGRLTSGTFLNRTAISDGGWSRLEYNGKTVYAVTSYLTTDAPEIKPPAVSDNNTEVVEYGMTFKSVNLNVTAKEEVNLRDKPATSDSNIIHTLKNGEYITKIGVCSSSGWARLQYNGQTVYCVDSFLLQ